jgi:hypothetical protein
MLLKILIILLLSPSINAFCNELKIVTQHDIFIVKYNNQFIRLKSHYATLSLIKNKCNKNIIYSFNSKLTHILSSKPLIKNKIKDGFIFYFNSKKYFEHLSSIRGKHLLNITSEIHRLKLEEKYLCDKK